MLGQYVRKSVTGSNGSSPQRTSGANIKKAVYENLVSERDIVLYRDTAVSMIVHNQPLSATNPTTKSVFQGYDKNGDLTTITFMGSTKSFLASEAFM